MELTKPGGAGSGLAGKKCVPCEGGEPPLRPDQIDQFRPQVPDWHVETVDGHPSLVKTFTFKDFVGSIDFVNKVRDVAEGEGHHPDLKIHWNKVRVENWTHATGGLHENDFILAAKIDQLVKS
ncbi:MAG: 4a-hydroxytetrahydrobiopterin dehydratase [Candidatus Kerfeldbacteria bacterium]|nr:4a-hydroxytetrahydrobiopterin dehydratase [Candidatus Kerfeldbacteria bacterium]